MTIIEMPDCCEKMCVVTLKDGRVFSGMTYTYSDHECRTYIEVDNICVYLSEIEKINIIE